MVLPTFVFNCEETRRGGSGKVHGYYYFYPHNPVYPRRLDPSVLVFSLSLCRHPSICILFTSRFTSDNKQRFKATMDLFLCSSRFIDS
jgi:hypothetical protein